MYTKIYVNVYIVAVGSAVVEFHEIHFCDDYAMAINSSMMADPFLFVVGIHLIDGLRVVDMKTSKYYAF